MSIRKGFFSTVSRRADAIFSVEYTTNTATNKAGTIHITGGASSGTELISWSTNAYGNDLTAITTLTSTNLNDTTFSSGIDVSHSGSDVVIYDVSGNYDITFDVSIDEGALGNANITMSSLSISGSVSISCIDV